MKHLELVFTNLNQRVDIVDDSSLQIIYQVMTDISTKGGAFSYDMNLTGSGNNNIIFNEIFDEHFYLSDTGTTIFLNKTIPAHLDFDGLPFLYGQFVLTEVDNDNGNITYVGHFTTELRTFGDELGDHKIIGNELDPSQPAGAASAFDISFSEYDHKFVWGNIDISNNTATSFITITGTTTYPTFSNFYNNSHGFYYGFIDLEGPNSINLIENNRALVQNFRPCIYAKELWDKIWAKTSYTYESDFINGSYFKQLVIPNTFDNNINNNRNPDGSSDEEFNVGLMTDFSGYDGVSTHANIYNFSGHTLNSYQIDIDPPFTYKTIPWNATGGTSSQGIDYFVNDNAFFYISGCTNGDCTWSDAQTPCCTSPYWQVTQSGNYDLTVELSYNYYWESMNGSNGATNGQGRDHIYTEIDIYCKYNDGSIRLLQREQQINAINWGIFNKKMVFSYPLQIICTLEGEDFWEGNKIFVVAGVRNRLSDMTVFCGPNHVWLDVQAGYSYFKNTYNSKPYFYYGQNVDMNKCLPPNYNQIDYVKDIMNYFCMVAQPVQGTKIIKVEPWDAFYNTTNQTDYLEWRGTTNNKLDNSQQKTIESIPDLVYQDFWLNPKSDSNDTNTTNYQITSNKLFGSVNIQNPYIKNDSKIITTNFAATMMNHYGNTNWITAQLWNKDKQPTSINIPPEQTYEPRLLFRTKLPASSSQPLSKLYAFGNYNNSNGNSADSVSIPVVTGTTLIFHLDANTDGSYPYFPYGSYDGYVMYQTDQSIFMMGTFVGYNPWNGVIGFQVKYCEGNSGTYGSASDEWFLSTISDATFGYGGQYPYQPYVGTLTSPYSALAQLDINFGLANYYFVPNPSANNVYNIFWKNKVNTYIDPNSKYVTYFVWLNTSDIMNLDFRKKILIDNNLYILNKITWSADKSAKCEMIKLSDYAAQQPMYVPGGGGFIGTGYTIGDGGGNAVPLVSQRFGVNNTQVMELYSNQGVQTTDLGYSGLTMNIVDVKNYYPQNSSGLIAGRSNVINGDSFHLLNSYNNIVNADNVIQINSINNVVNHDATVLINSSGVTTTQTGKTYINSKDVSTLADVAYVDTISGNTITYVNKNFYSNTTDIVLSGGTDVLLGTNSYIYFGDKTTAGTFRMYVDTGTGKLSIENYRAGTWHNAGNFTPA